MRSLAFPAVVAAAACLVTRPARAEGPDPVLAFAAGAATIVAGFAVGGTFIAANQGDAAKATAGWFMLEGAFPLAPFVSHAMVGEWVRGAVFAAVPVGTTLGTIPIFSENGAAVEHGELPQQRIMWALFCTGLAASMAGVIDTVFAPGRALHVAPVVGAGSAGVVVGGAL